MALVDSEIQTLINSLRRILWGHTINGITHRPFGLDWVKVETWMHRLLVLRGVVREGEIVQGDPWMMFLSEYGPRDMIIAPGFKPVRPYFPSGILLPSSQCTLHQRLRQRQTQNQSQGQGQGESTSGAAPRRVHFQCPLPRRPRDDESNSTA